MTYSEKLKDPRWQKKRLEILDRDEFTCKLCRSKDHTLHVHHFFYEKGKEPWDYPDGSLDTYCHYCHSMVEFFKSYDEKILICEIIRVMEYSDGSIVFNIICIDNRYRAAIYVVRYFSGKQITPIAYLESSVIRKVQELNESIQAIFL